MLAPSMIPLAAQIPDKQRNFFSLGRLVDLQPLELQGCIVHLWKALFNYYLNSCIALLLNLPTSISADFFVDFQSNGKVSLTKLIFPLHERVAKALAFKPST